MISRFKHQRGDGKEGKLGSSEASCHSANIPGRDSLSIMTLQKTPILNLDPLTHWSTHKNIACVRIDGERSWGLLNNGSTINAVTPGFITAHHLDVSPLSNLVYGMVGINGFWRINLSTLGPCYHKGSGRRDARLWWRLSGPGHTRFNQHWIPSASYFGHTNHQLNHKYDQREQNRWAIGFLEWLRISYLWTHHRVELSIRSEWWALLVSQLECHEYLYQDDHREQLSHSHGAKPDCHSDHHYQECQGHSSSSCKCGAPSGGCVRNIEARWDWGYPAN